MWIFFFSYRFIYRILLNTISTCVSQRKWNINPFVNLLIMPRNITATQAHIKEYSILNMINYIQLTFKNSTNFSWKNQKMASHHEQTIISYIQNFFSSKYSSNRIYHKDLIFKIIIFAVINLCKYLNHDITRQFTKLVPFIDQS